MQEKPKHAAFYKVLMVIAVAVTYITVTLSALYLILPTFFISFIIAGFILIVLAIYSMRLGKLIDKNSAKKETLVSFWVMIFIVNIMAILMIYTTAMLFRSLIAGLGDSEAPSTFLPWEFLWIIQIMSLPLVLDSLLISVYFIKRDEDSIKSPKILSKKEEYVIKQNIING